MGGSGSSSGKGGSSGGAGIKNTTGASERAVVLLVEQFLRLLDMDLLR